MANAEIVGDRIEITAEYREKDLVKKIPGTRYDRKARVWHAPISWGVAWALRGVFGTGVVVGPELTRWASHEYDHRVAPSVALRTATDALGDDRLYPFQRVGVEFLRRSERALLSDEMGLGKTVQTIIALEAAPGPILIVCPNSVKRNWGHEFDMWDTNRTVAVLEGNITKRRATIQDVADGEFDILVVNWEQLKLHSRLAPYGSIALRRCEVCQPATETRKQHLCEHCEKELNAIPWTAVVADEAHRMKNPKAKQTRALWWVGRGVEIKYALTGTPIADKPDDLWSIMHFVAPEDWPTRAEFIERYCLSSWNKWGGIDIIGLKPSTKDEFFSILDPRFLRRPKAAVLPELPPKIYTRRDVDLTPKQAKAYKDMTEMMIAELDAGGIAAVTNALVKMRRLLQLTSAFASVDEQDAWKLIAPSSKLEALLEVLEEAGDQAVVVFAESRQLIQLVEAALTERETSFASIHGAVSTAERDRGIERLDAGDVKIMLCTLGAGGEGLNLNTASTIVFLERSYSLIHNLQAEDRLHRIGQTADEVQVIDIIATGTIDEDRLAAKEGKLLSLAEIVRDEETLRRFLS